MLITAGHLVALLAVALTWQAWRADADPQRLTMATSWAAAGVAVIAVSWFLSRRRAGGRFDSISVDARGALSLRRRGDGVVQRATVDASRRAGPLVALDLRDEAGRRAGRLLIARDQCSAPEWRSLQAWLNWLERSPH